MKERINPSPFIVLFPELLTYLVNEVNLSRLDYLVVVPKNIIQTNTFV